MLYIVFVCIFVIPSSPPCSIFPCTSIAIQRFSRNNQTIFVQQPSPPQLQHLLTPRSLHNVHCSKAHGVLSGDPSAGAWRNPWTYHVFGKLRDFWSFFLEWFCFCLQKKIMCPSHIYWCIWKSEAVNNTKKLAICYLHIIGTTGAQSKNKDSGQQRVVLGENSSCPPKKCPHLLKTASSWSWFCT